MYLKQLSLLRCAFLLCVFVCVCVCVCVFVCVCLCVRLHMNLCSYMNLHFKFKMAFYWVFAYCISMIWISLDLTLFREKALKMFKSSLTEGGEFDAMMLVITMTITWHVSHTVPNCTLLQCTALQCTALFCTLQHCIILYCTSLWYERHCCLFFVIDIYMEWEGFGCLYLYGYDMACMWRAAVWVNQTHGLSMLKNIFFEED